MGESAHMVTQWNKKMMKNKQASLKEKDIISIQTKLKRKSNCFLVKVKVTWIKTTISLKFGLTRNAI